MSEADTGLRRSPLHAEHRALGAKLVPFGGWDMPLNYEPGTLAEHLACRHDAVVFDVSHLGTVRVVDADALHRLQAAFTNDLAKVAPGRAQYTHLCDEADGTVLDDIIVWWVADASFDVMPNASNTSRVLAAVGGLDVTDTRAVLAVQGPHHHRAAHHNDDIVHGGAAPRWSRPAWPARSSASPSRARARPVPS